MPAMGLLRAISSAQEEASCKLHATWFKVMQKSLEKIVMQVGTSNGLHVLVCVSRGERGRLIQKGVHMWVWGVQGHADVSGNYRRAGG